MLAPIQTRMPSLAAHNNPPAPFPQTPDTENQQPPPLPASPSTFAPRDTCLPTSPGIPPATVQFPLLANAFKVSDQQAFLQQHDDLTRAMQRLHNQQPSFKAFQQQQLASMFSDQPHLNPADLIYKRWIKKSDGSIKMLSEEPLLAALEKQVAKHLSTSGKKDDSHIITGVFTPRSDTQPSTEVIPSKPLDTLVTHIATQYPAAVQAFWTTPKPTEKKPTESVSPHNQLLTLHKQQLSTMAALRVSDGTLSAASKQMIDDALQYPTLAEREKAFADGARLGVYPLTLDDGTERGALLAGTFLITQTDGSFSSTPTWPHGRSLALNDANGPVVLYTPGEGFEAFATPAEARQALAQRLDQGGIDADLLLQTVLPAVQNLAVPPDGENLMLGAEPLAGDVLAEGIPWMLKRQQAEISAAMVTNPTSSQAIDAAADWTYLLDGSNAMLARDTKLADKLAPEWLKNLTAQQQTLFEQLEHAEEKSANTLAPLLEKIPALSTFSRDKMNEAIKKLYPTAQVNADQLMVQVRTQTHVQSGRQSGRQTPFVKNYSLSLTDFALKNPTEFPAGEYGRFTRTTLELPLTDTEGKPLLDVEGKPVTLTAEQLKTLVNTADVGGEYTQLLETELTPDTDSSSAAALRSAWKASQAAGMEKQAFLAQLHPGIYKAEATEDKSKKRGAQWVSAVMNHPDPLNRAQVDRKTITANTLAYQGVEAPGVMVIGNQTDSELVLYTPDAPDGQAFREVANLRELNTLLNTPAWKTYIENRRSPLAKNSTQQAAQFLKKNGYTPSTNPYANAVMTIGDRQQKQLGATLTPIKGHSLEQFYIQQAQKVIDNADHQSTSSAEVAAQSTVNKVQFGIEVGLIFLDLVPVVSKGVSTGFRLGKASVSALRANAKLLPRLIKSPNLARTIYSDFTVAAAGIPNLRAAPLRPVVKPLAIDVTPTPGPVIKELPTPGNPVPPPTASTSTGITASVQHEVTPLYRNRDMSAFTVPDEVVKDAVLGSNGTYNVGGNYYAPFIDISGARRIYQIESAFHARNGRVNIIDPHLPESASKIARRQGTLALDRNGEWLLVSGPGGAKPKPQKRTVLTESSIHASSTNQQLTDHPNWQSIVDSGSYNGQPVYIHYTSKEGAKAIAQQRSINDLARGERRAGSKGGVYVNPPGQQFNNENVENLLFLGNERYAGSGDYMVIFSTGQTPLDLGPVTAGSQFVELKMDKAIKLESSNFLYLGPNKFPDWFI